MTDAIIAFWIASAISFYGSLQLGLVNAAVIQTAIKKGTLPALMLAIGGVLPEIPYVLIAMLSVNFTQYLVEHSKELGFVFGGLIIAIGIFQWLKKEKEEISDRHKDPSQKKFGFFMRGLVLALLNPQLILFWAAVIVAIDTGAIDFLTQTPPLINFEVEFMISPKWSFALGAAFGALVMLIIYIRLVRKYRQKIDWKIIRRINKIIGTIFIIFGLYVMLRAFF
jgi:threonine/homoserine/homoserine lactone efflux protein